MPVVSQSIIRPMVPVGASTDACALRQPFVSPILLPVAHSCVAASKIDRSMSSKRRASSFAAACLRMTRACAAALRAYPAYGPTTPASSAERRYDVPVISEVIAPASARPPSESYAWPEAISSAPRFA